MLPLKRKEKNGEKYPEEVVLELPRWSSLENVQNLSRSSVWIFFSFLPHLLLNLEADDK